jgi:hypothetical protein
MLAKPVLFKVAPSALVALALCGAGCSPANGETSPGSGAGGSGGNGGNAGNGTGGGSGGSAGGALGSGGSGGNGGTDGSGGTTPGDGSIFDWPETPPGSGGECKPGRYEGTFECTYTDTQGTPALDVSGPIRLTLVRGEQGEILEVRDGKLDGTANAVFTFSADITGELDCGNARFSGRLVNGVYSGFIFVTGTFEGPFDSRYDRRQFSLIDGSWLLTVTQSGGTCPGTWTANYVGP